MHRTLFHTCSAACTERSVYAGQIVLYEDRPMLTLLLANAAAQASGTANLLHLRPPVPIRTADRQLLICRHQFNQLLRADSRAPAAARTFLRIRKSHSVFHPDRVKSTGFYAGSEAQTAVIAFP